MLSGLLLSVKACMGFGSVWTRHCRFWERRGGCDARRTSQNATFMSFLLAEHSSSGWVGCQLMHSTWLLCPPDNEVVPRTSIWQTSVSALTRHARVGAHTPFWLPDAYGALVSTGREIFAIAAPRDGQHGVLGAHTRVTRAPGGEVWRLRVTARHQRPCALY